MGERAVEKPWAKLVDYVVRVVSERLERVEAVIVFSSWARSGGGEWSDLDVLIVADSVRDVEPLDRFTLFPELLARRVEVFPYTFEELESMARRGNPLALSALIEGHVVFASSRVLELASWARRTYRRGRGRVWMWTG